MPWEGEFSAAALEPMLRDIMYNNGQTLGRTDRFYEVRNAAGEIIVATGVAVWSFVRPPEMWLLLAKPFLRNVRDSILRTREAQRLPAARYPNLVCDVAKDNKRELHFVRALGWVPTGVASLRPNGADFIQFKVT